jgi:hypothetical protein
MCGPWKGKINPADRGYPPDRLIFYFFFAVFFLAAFFTAFFFAVPQHLVPHAIVPHPLLLDWHILRKERPRV